MRPYWRFFGVFGVAYLLAVVHERTTVSRGMPEGSVLPRAHIIGHIVSIPSSKAYGIHFECMADAINGKAVHARLLVSCYKACPSLHVGQTWRFVARLRRVHSLNNPGGFDYKRLLATRHITWRATALGSAWQALPSKNHYSITAWREGLAFHLASLIPEKDILGIVEALSLGITNHMSSENWTLFRHTGTTHLMVISGAHIGLIAGMLFQGMRQAWTRSKRLCLRYPAPKVASIVAIFAGFIYALLAGFGVSAERSAVASIFMFMRPLSHKQWSVWQAWRYALLIVLLTEPHAVLMPGLYLSFMAVAILLIMNRRIAARGVQKILLLQLACMLGLLPLTLFWFAYGALTGLLANLLAIPLVSFIVTPLALLSLVLPLVIPPLKVAIALLLHYLQWVDTLAFCNMSMVYEEIFLPLLAVVAMLISLALPLKGMLPTAMGMLLTAAYPAVYPRLSAGEYQVAVLDVGQGSAMIVRTQHHNLVYDTGGKIYHGSDMGSLVLIPALRSLQVKHLDKVVISHPDLDHRGGLASLEAAYPQEELIVDDPRFYHRGQPCYHYAPWVWDGVFFRFFNSQGSNKNNHSCVLQISNSAGQILFTGDIEQEAERHLITTYGKALQSTVLIVPHHGSKTSSSFAFLKQVAPRYAVLSYGLNNRYHFPHPTVLARYQQAHVTLYNTADQGMISLWFKRDAVQISPYLEKK